MRNVAEHYATHLAPVYLWMAGGLDAAVARGEAEIDAICPTHADGLLAIDLGAGFGMHAIPLARRGYAVLAIDTSTILLETLQQQAGKLAVRTVVDDLTAFRSHQEVQADLILCMGDTLTHLPDLRSVETLFADIAQALQPGGSFVVSFRDYTTPLIGEARFIPVKSDNDRILTCFLEYGEEHVTVHDVLHERDGTSWRQRVSAYQKIRLPPDWIAESLQVQGFSVRIEPGMAGMVRVVATSRSDLLS